MRKELLFAIFVGGILGLIIAFGIWRINSTLKPTSNKTSNSQTNEDNSNQKNDFAITLAKPSDLDVITEDSLNVSGITQPGSYIVISLANNDYVLLTNQDGSFDQDIVLVPGLNELNVFAFNQSGKSASQKISIVYSSEFGKLIKNPASTTPSPSPETTKSPTSTTDADTQSVREKVQQKVEAALKNPKAYLGTITDIMDSTVQIKTPAGEIQQLSLNTDTVFIKMGTVNKEVKRSDMAIGDFIVAMGFVDGNTVLDTKRVLITSVPTPSTKKVLLGKINKYTKTDLIIQSISSTESLNIDLATKALLASLSGSKFTKIKLSDFDEGDIIILVGENKKDSFEVRTLVKILPATPPPASTTPSPTPKPSPTPSPKPKS